MQILLVILIATTASQVQSAGFVCSKFPLLSNLYSSALEISSWNIPLESFKTRMDRARLQEMTNYITNFKDKYEVAKNEVDCKPLLCDLKPLLLRNGRNDRTIESYTPQEYRVVLEDYVEQLGRGVYNLSSAYCQAAGKKLQEIVDLAGPLKDELFKFPGNPDNFDDYDYASIAEALNTKIILKYKGAEKIQCRYLNPENLYCIDHDFLHSYYFKEIPQDLQKHINYFVENCNKVKNELESMKGPGIVCLPK